MNAFGISVAREEFQRIIDENLGGLESIKAIVDDILIWGEDDSSQEATASHNKKLLALYDKYVKGKDPLIADALSRSQTTNQNRSKMEQEIETTRLVQPKFQKQLSRIRTYIL